MKPRERECLRLVHKRWKTKEIARALGGLSAGTVDGYLADAQRTLGARDRREAAEWLHEFEAAKSDPKESGVQSPWIVFALLRDAVAGSSSARARIAQLLPVRRKGAQHNELSITARLGWIIAIAFALAVGFGAFADAVRIISTIVAGTR